MPEDTRERGGKVTDEQEKPEEKSEEQPIDVGATERVTKALSCGGSVTICGRLRMRDVRKWQAAEEKTDLWTCYRYLAAMIVEWSFDGDPANPESYDNLWQHEMRQVNKAVGEHVMAQTQAKN